VSVNDAVEGSAWECTVEDRGNMRISKKQLAEMGGEHRLSVPFYAAASHTTPIVICAALPELLYRNSPRGQVA
jgi:hypothetical protein